MEKVRSPNYPALDLGAALALTKKLYDKAQRHPMPINAVVSSLWGFKPGSYSDQCAGALRAFGLVTWDGASENRKISVTPDAAKILDNHPERAALLKKAALTPKIHELIWSKYEAAGSLPPDETLMHYLVHENEPPFNRGKVEGFIKQFRGTLSVAGLDGSDILVDENYPEGGDSEEPDDSPAPPDTLRRKPKDPTVKEDVFTLASGEAVLRWPGGMSQADFEDFAAWLEIVKRKALRLVSEHGQRESAAKPVE